MVKSDQNLVDVVFQCPLAAMSLKNSQSVERVGSTFEVFDKKNFFQKTSEKTKEIVIRI